MLIDFKEIPSSKGDGHHQDIFEKFSRDFLAYLGYKIVSGPARGADGGIDLKVLEIRVGEDGQPIEFYWLVSCKHYAHSGGSITKEIEADIRDRVEANGCQGFMGFYSTIANQSLLDALEGLKGKLEFQLYDNEKIENNLVGVHSAEDLLMRYFPESFKKWKELYNYTEPIQLFEAHLKTLKDTAGNLGEVGLFEELFHSTGNLIKQLRKHPSLNDAIQNEHINYLVVGGFEGDFPYKGIFGKIMDKRIPDYVEQNFNIKIDSKPLRCMFGGDFRIKYALYANYLLVSPSYDEILNESFLALKNILY